MPAIACQAKTVCDPRMWSARRVVRIRIENRRTQPTAEREGEMARERNIVQCVTEERYHARIAGEVGDRHTVHLEMRDVVIGTADSAVKAAGGAPVLAATIGGPKKAGNAPRRPQGLGTRHTHGRS
jgi:hypothetical protein